MCKCGCNTCDTKPKGPLLTESKVKSLLSEGLQYHINKKIPLFETIYRIGSDKHLALIKEARKMYSRNVIDLCEEDEALIKTHLGEFSLYEGESVPLDLPMLNEGEIKLEKGKLYRSTIEIYQGPHKGENFIADEEYIGYDGFNYVFKIVKIHTPELAKYLDVKVGDNSTTGMGAIIRDYQNLNEAEFKGKDVTLNKPKRGGSKAYYVYVKDGDKVKKVSFGSGGLRAKIKNKEARNAFAARHNCKDKKDRTKAGYWSCRLPYYAKALGLGANMQTFW